MLAQTIPAGISDDAGKSVSRLITIGTRAGFEKIVLVGIDLNSPLCFFASTLGTGVDETSQHSTPGGTGGSADAEETTTRSFPATVFIPALPSAIQSVTGSQVFVSSRYSALLSSLHVFPWTDESGIL